MKIVFINLPSPWLINDKTYLALGPLYIAAYLEKHNFKVEFSDLASKSEDQWNIPDDADIYALGATTPQIPIAIKISRKIKKLNPKALAVIGGIHATVLPEETLLTSDFDVCVIGEGEETMHEIARKEPLSSIKGIAYKKDGKVIMNERRPLIEDLDSIPYPAYHLVNILEYAPAGYKMTGSVISSRGCPFNCIFCAQKEITKKRVRYRSVENVIGELKFLKEKYGLDTFCFEDETFTVSRKRLIDLCKEIKKLDIHFKCSGRVDRVDYELLKIMKDSGCFEIGFGIESGSQRVLDIIGKGTTVELNRKAILAAKKAGLRTMAFLMAGSPTEDDDSIEATIRFLEEVQPDACSVGMFTPYPGTDVYNDPKKYNFSFIKPEDYNKYQIFNREGTGISLHTNREKIERLHRKLFEHVRDKSSFFRKDKTYEELLKESKMVKGET